ncbi:MAG: GGDEF domain-containing protein [Hydrogenovibrio sp.]
MNQRKTHPVGFRVFAFKKFMWVSIFALLASLTITTLVSGTFVAVVYHKTVSNLPDRLQQTFSGLAAAENPAEQADIILAQIQRKNLQNDFNFIPASDIRNTPLALTDTQQQNLKAAKQANQLTHQLDILSAEVNGGLPVYFQPGCDTCNILATQGRYMGTLLFQLPLTSPLLTFGTLWAFFIIFMVSFFVIGVYMMTRALEKDFIQPIRDLSERMHHIRLEEDDILWERKEQEIAEIDLIDQLITENIQTLKSIYVKLDALMVTEHQSGFFHQDRFKEALQFEVYRSDRYHRPFSILVIKLLKVESKQTEKNPDTAEQIHLFAETINEHTRNIDMPFRIGERLFLIIMPEMTEQEVPVMSQVLRKRFAQDREDGEDRYKFDVQIGYATYNYDTQNIKELTALAIERMHQTEAEETPEKPETPDSETA